MKKQMLTLLFLLTGLFMVSGQNLPVIQIANNTGFHVFGLFISSSESEELGDNVIEDLEGEILGDSEALEIMLHTPLSVNDTYDIFMLDENESWYVKLGEVIYNNARIVFTSDDLLY